MKNLITKIGDYALAIAALGVGGANIFNGVMLMQNIYRSHQPVKLETTPETSEVKTDENDS